MKYLEIFINFYGFESQHSTFYSSQISKYLILILMLVNHNQMFIFLLQNVTKKIKAFHQQYVTPCELYHE